MARTIRPTRFRRLQPLPKTVEAPAWSFPRVLRFGLTTFCLGIALAIFGYYAWQVHQLTAQVRQHQSAIQDVVNYINKQVEQGNQTPQQLQLLQQQIDQLHQSEPVVPTANTGSGSSATTSSSREARR
jgi:cell division protein FtsB